jgi:DNA replication and repair protein RecF
LATPLRTVDRAVFASRSDPAPAAAVTRLTLSDFRCYRHLRLELAAQPVVLAGPNGAGKTNVLEALSFLAPGRGLRRATLSDVARRDRLGAPEAGLARPWGVAARLVGPKGVAEIGTGFVPADGGREKRLAHIDGQPLKSQAGLAEALAVQWLTPAMDRLFADGPAARRRFLDRLVLGLDPAHAGRTAAYEHALRERSRLLIAGAARRDWDASWLAVLEDTMATKGVAVAAARRDAVTRLDQVCRDSRGPFPGARLALEGEIESWLAAGPALAAEDRFRGLLAATRSKDADTGGASVGPHRSDLVVRHALKDQPADACSTGEQKALLVAIVLGNARLLAAERGAAPVLLLDEVAAHLDEARRAALFEHLADLGAQAWLTGTEAGLFAALEGRAQFFHVKDATVTPA